MAGTGACAEQAIALRRLAARSRNGAADPDTGSVSGVHGGVHAYRGLAVDLLVGWLVAALAAAMIVWLSAAIVPAPGPPPVPMPAPDLTNEMGEDLNPRDPLVMCTVFVDHTTCAREPS